MVWWQKEFMTPTATAKDEIFLLQDLNHLSNSCRTGSPMPSSLPLPLSNIFQPGHHIPHHPQEEMRAKSAISFTPAFTFIPYTCHVPTVSISKLVKHSSMSVVRLSLSSQDSFFRRHDYQGVFVSRTIPLRMVWAPLLIEWE